MPAVEIVIAGTRPGRVGPAVARWIEKEAGGHGGFTPVDSSAWPR